MQHKAADAHLQSLVRRYEQLRSRGESIYLDANDFERLIEHYLLENDNATAAELIELALSIHPNNEFILLKKAAWLLQCGRPKDALRLVQHLPRNEDSELMLASVYLALNRRDEALEIFNRHLAQETDELYLYCSDVAEVLMHYDLYDKAKVFVDKGLADNPKDEELYEQAIELCYLRGDSEASIDYYQRWLDEDPFNVQAWTRLGSTYLNLNRPQEAVNALEFAAAAADSPDLNICVELGHAYGRLNNYPKAIECYTQAYELLQHDNESTSLGLGDLAGCLAECYEYQNDFDQAIEWYRKAFELNPEDDMACVGIAYCLAQRNEPAQAMSYYEQALQINPTNKDIWVGMAELLVNLGQFDAAIMAYKQALEGVKDPGAEELFALGNLYFQTGDYTLALEIFQQMEDSGKDMPNLQLCMALCYHMLLDTEQCERYLRRALAKDPQARQLYDDILKELAS